MISFRPVNLDRDLDRLHAWITHPRSVFWAMPDATREQVRQEYERIGADPHHDAWIGSLDSEPVFLAETYDPAHSELAGHYDVLPGDVGMHVLVAPPSGPPRHGLTSAVMRAVMEFVFADPTARRVVVEPDERNEAIARKNAEVGFVEAGRIQLRDKVARLSFCTRSAFLATAPAPPSHLEPDAMRAAHRRLIAKAIAEFSHERLLAPDSVPDGYRLGPYRFRAQRYPLEHWVVDPASVSRDDGVELDARDFVTGFADRLGIPPHLLGTYLEEVSATLAATAWKLRHERHPAAELARADF